MALNDTPLPDNALLRGNQPGAPSIQFRTIDGSGNNLQDPSLNAAGQDFTRIGPAEFTDGISQPVDGPNPRTISNLVVGQGNADVSAPEGVSGMMYAWGQFVDHDLDLSNSDGVTNIGINVPNGDPTFPDGSVIAVTRAIVDPATGAGTATPATAVNAITGWLDGSQVYGSDPATAASLRTADGHMKTSAGDNLPIVNGQFLAGDVRAQENPSLTALQTLFVREHNFQVDRLAAQHPDWSGDQLYQQARAIVTAEIENITYTEFLPHLLGPDAIAPYHGYDPTVDPTITEEFAGAAYRFGHSIVSGETQKIGENGAANGPSQSLADVFFESPSAFAANSGADGILRHLASDPSQALDARIVPELRNFLNDPPSGMDLAAINIQRGRDLGLGTLNQTRVALGLAPYTSFDRLTSDPGTLAGLKQAYTSIDQVDLWTGGLAENHAPGAMVGPTFQKIIASQFENLRDGDRLWFENQGFDPRTLQTIENTTLSDIIKRDTDTTSIQPDAFMFFDRHSGVAGGVPADDPNAPQLVIGSNGKDTLTGGAAGDILIAGAGRQTLTGGAGADQFVVNERSTVKITDFQVGVDQLVSQSKLVNLGSDRNGNALVGAGDARVDLIGVTPQQFFG